MLLREQTNPIIKPTQIVSSREDFEVTGAFNAAATLGKDGRTYLLLRVTEKPINENPNQAIVPVFNYETGQLEKKVFEKEGSGIDFSDPRSFRVEGKLHLTSMAHLRGAWSDDGVHFEVEKEPAVFPGTRYEAYGCEDPRISYIEGRYALTYSSVSENGVCSALAVSENLKTFERKGLIFLPNNRNINIFPEKINGQYVAFHRPITSGWCKNSIWIAYSPDMIHWGGYKKFFTPEMSGWCKGKVGAGAPPIKTDKGWLVIYHGVEENGKKEKYSLGVMLLDINNPEVILGNCKTPILTPQEPYETTGFVNDVVFTCGAVKRKDDRIDIYYGATDETLCLAKIEEKELFNNVI
jgi:predicted GH43/DUF377 family glycosyl hydrolase